MTIYRTSRNLWGELALNNKALFSLTLCFILFSAALDILVVGGIMPLISLYTDTNSNVVNFLQLYLPAFNFKDYGGVKIFASTIYLAIVVVSLIVKSGSNYLLYKFTHTIGSDCASKIFKNSMSTSYEYHLKRKSSDLISALTIKCNDVVLYSTSFLQILVSLVNLIILLSFLLFIDFSLATFVLVFVSVSYGSIYLMAKRTLLRNGEVAAKNSENFISLSQEGVLGFRDVVLENIGSEYINNFKQLHVAYMKALGKNSLVATLPKYFFDFTVYVVIVSILNGMIPGGGDYLHDLAKLSAFALAIQRVSPLAHVLYSSFSNMSACRESVNLVLKLIKENYPITRKSINFNNFLELKNISYKYSQERSFALKNVSLKISKSEWVVFMGKSGSGKSTLLDIILGLLKPTHGELIVDGVAYQGGAFIFKNSAHVSQNVHLFQNSILHNIVLSDGAASPDLSRVNECLKLVDLYDFVYSLPNNLNSKLGDLGGGLSGGQKQRLGIARALYKKPDLLVLDEATSAIDGETADLIMKNIRTNMPELTCIRITHRVSDIDSGESVYSVSSGDVWQSR